MNGRPNCAQLIKISKKILLPWKVFSDGRVGNSVDNPVETLSKACGLRRKTQGWTWKNGEKTVETLWKTLQKEENILYYSS